MYAAHPGKNEDGDADTCGDCYWPPADIVLYPYSIDAEGIQGAEDQSKPGICWRGAERHCSGQEVGKCGVGHESKYRHGEFALPLFQIASAIAQGDLSAVVNWLFGFTHDNFPCCA